VKTNFIGILPDYFSFNEQDLAKLAVVPFMRRPLSQKEIMRGRIFKGPFVVSHPSFDNEFVCFNLGLYGDGIEFTDGDKIFNIPVAGKVVMQNQIITITDPGGKKIKIRALQPTDPMNLERSKEPLGKFAKSVHQKYMGDVDE
jgi:hypothetical protein